MKILITGDGGKLGHAAKKRFQQEDIEVVGFDVRNSLSEDIVAHPENLPMAGCDGVLHCAALPYPGLGNFERYFYVNVVGTHNVIDAAVAAGVKRFVYLSSTAYYGCNVDGRLEPAYFPIDEAHPIASIEGYSEGRLDIYNQSKVMAEQIVAYFGTNRMIEAVSLRLAPANTKGQQYPADFDWRTDDTYRRGCFFVNCHPVNAIEACLLAFRAEGPFWYEAFNLTDKYAPQSVDVLEFLAAEYPGVEHRWEIESDTSLISSEKAVQELGWTQCEDR